MPSCAAVGCSNRSEKGCRMLSFPRDPELRKIWQERAGRADWKPSNNSFLCQYHFESDKWCTMENGRVRLKKHAIPSIFVNSFRRFLTGRIKSIKESIEIAEDNNENNCEIEYSVMHVENDREHSSIDFLEETYPDSQNIDDPSIQLFAHQQINNFSKSNQVIESKSFPVQHHDLQQENILISDNSEKEVIKICKVEKQKDEEENKKSVNDFVSNLADNSNEDLIKSGLKEEAAIPVRDNYDELEEKLKQICDGYFDENNPDNLEKSYSISDNQKEVLQQASNKTPVHRSINYKHSPGNNIGHMLTNETENIEIIFSAENGEEDMCARKNASHNNDVADEIEILDPHAASTDNVSHDKEIEQSVNVAPNIVAAMKRKRRTRDEIMKSIEQSICNVSSQDTNSLSDSDTHDDTTEAERHKKKVQKTQDKSSSDSNASPTTTRFTVKVTGHPDDVSDIMHNLLRVAGDPNLQEYNDVGSSKEDDGFVTSVITIDDCPVDVDDKADFQDDDSVISCIRDVTSNDRMLPSTSENCRWLSTKVTSHFNKELNDLNTNNTRLIPVVKNVIELPANDRVLKCEYEKLQQKLSMQANVVKELSNQLIYCKRIEHGLQNKNSTLEKKVQSMLDELNALSNDASSPISVLSEEFPKQVLIDDLKRRLNHFEEANKKLVKNASVRTEYVKKLESQIKQKDNRIKELNWKVDKASKFFDRAERNMNTYRKKFLSLQNTVRKKKFSDDKVIKFNEILVDIVKKNYSGRILPMSVAVEMKKLLGTVEYEKLFRSGFPLPSLTAVQDADDSLSVSNESINEVLPLEVATSRRNVNPMYDAKYTGNRMQIDSGNVKSVDDDVAFDDTETVMGTVQDIFDESNNDDDFSTNELTEHFISLLHKIM